MQPQNLKQYIGNILLVGGGMGEPGFPQKKNKNLSEMKKGKKKKKLSNVEEEKKSAKVKCQNH